MKVLLAPVLALTLFGVTIPQAWAWWKGEDAFNDQKFPQAAQTFAKGLTGGEATSQSKLAYNQGDSLYRAKDWAKSEEAFAKAATVDAKNWRALYNEGNAQVQQGYQDGKVTSREKLEAAVKSYESALKVQPNDADTQHNLEYVKKLLEQDQQQQQDKDKDKDKNQDKSKDQKQDQNKDGNDKSDQNKDGEKDKDQSGDNKDQNKDQGKDKQDQQGKDKNDQKDQGKDQQNQNGQDQNKPNQQGGGGDQQQNDQGQQQPQPDLSYSQNVLNRLAREEAMYQQYRAMQQGQSTGDPIADMWNQVFKDPGQLLFGNGPRREPVDPDAIDW